MINKNKNTIWYFPIETIKSRYTQQLCENWMPSALISACKRYNKNFEIIQGESNRDFIKVGSVLDATGRGIYSLQQSINFLKQIDSGNVKTNDIIFLQDYWTSGLEAVFYALDLHKIKVNLYSMCHAQSVDEFDFTYPMRDWMRHFELGLDNKHSGIFVASTIHKQQLRECGFKSPIYVVSLPISYKEVEDRMKDMQKNTENSVVYSSRIDWEKNPKFMLRVAKRFLDENRDWKWYVTTSNKELRSNDESIIKDIRKMELKESRFKVLTNLTKDEYYEILCKSKIQFNSSKQDYVSWTLLEAVIAECDICYPNFRSFIECIPEDRRYENENVESAVKLLSNIIKNSRTHKHIAILSNKGRLLEAEIIIKGSKKERNIWNE